MLRSRAAGTAFEISRGTGKSDQGFASGIKIACKNLRVQTEDPILRRKGWRRAGIYRIAHREEGDPRLHQPEERHGVLPEIFQGIHIYAAEKGHQNAVPFA